MGQKYSEHPSVDYYVQLTRSAKKAGAFDTLPRRTVGNGDFGNWELDRFHDMMRLVNRTVVGAAIDVKPGGVSSVPAHSCIRCGRPLEDGSGRVVRQSWGLTGGHTDYKVCSGEDTDLCAHLQTTRSVGG